MAWTVLAAVLFIANIIFVRKRLLARYWTGGLWAAAIYFLLIHVALALDLYSFQNQFYIINDIPLFLLVATFFFGILFIRFQPERKGSQLIYMIIIALFLTLLEAFFHEMDVLIYHNWQNSFSLVLNFFSLITLSWLSDLTVPKRKGFFFH